jgi:peptide/nickel transport system permease protein
VKLVRAMAVIFLTLVGAAALTCGTWEKTLYDAQFRESPDAAPSRRFPLGTDALGRDRFARLAYGTRISLLLAPAAALLSCLAAALLGGIAGLAGGIVERAILAAADLFLSLPWLFLLLIARACLPLNVPAILSVSITFALLGLLGWAGPARVVRAAVLDLRNSDFVLFARASGCTFWRLLWAHLVPNVMPVLRAQFRIAVPVYILAESTLGMLGLGVSEPLPSWGGLLRELEGADVPSRLWLLAPALLLAAVTLSLQLLRPDKDLAT